MDILLNDQHREITTHTTVLQLLNSIAGDASHNGIAVAVNDAVVPRTAWHQQVLQPHDSVLIIKATQGG